LVPGIANHAMPRGNRRQETFCNEEDYATYLVLLSDWVGPPSEAASQSDGRNEYDVPGIAPASCSEERD